MKPYFFLLAILLFYISDVKAQNEHRPAIGAPGDIKTNEISKQTRIKIHNGYGPNSSELPPKWKKVKEENMKHAGQQEPGQVVNTYIVSDPGDEPDDTVYDGIYDPPTLHSAIQNANYSPGHDVIKFAPGITVIDQQNSYLPDVQDPVTIDGGDTIRVTIIGDGILVDTSNCLIKSIKIQDAAFDGIYLHGDSNTVENCIVDNANSSGFTIDKTEQDRAVNNLINNCESRNNETGINLNWASHNVIDYNDIYNNSGNGIALLLESNDNLIIDNYIGTKDGLNPAPNEKNGILVESAKNDIIGNLISGNKGDGIRVDPFEHENAYRNRIENNFIGTDYKGEFEMGNGGGILGGNGIYLLYGNKDTILSNLVSGNVERGIGIGEVDHVYIAYNTVGSNYDIDTALGNGYSGISTGGNHLKIVHNWVCGGKSSGIDMDGDSCIVQSNYIGLKPDGEDTLGNEGDGIRIGYPGAYNIIGGSEEDRNYIAGNGEAGVYVVSGSTNNNVVSHNYIGTDTSSTKQLPNEHGVYIEWARDNVVEKNVLSGNSKSGVMLQGYTCHDNIIRENKIGTDKTGKRVVPNKIGVKIDNAPENTIGEEGSDFSNLISGNYNDGVYITGDSAYANVVKNNLIGLGIEGLTPMPNNNRGIHIDTAQGNIIGMATANGGNHIASNGLGIKLNVASSTTVQGNTLGIKVNGDTLENSSGKGIWVDQGKQNIIGAASEFGGNLISGYQDIGLELSNTEQNEIQNNKIGTDESGTAPLANYSGIRLVNASKNKIGVATEMGGNLLSGNDRNGIHLKDADSNTIENNYIGTDKNGENKVSNGRHGIYLEENSEKNVIGGNTDLSKNTISGNAYDGIHIDSTCHNNSMVGNFIGLNEMGNDSLSNGLVGIYIYKSNNNTIGSKESDFENVISGNRRSGVLLKKVENTTIQNNFIGTDPDGLSMLGNDGNGILLVSKSKNNQIGGADIDSENIISGNTYPGIYIDSLCRKNIIQGNLVGLDESGTTALANDVGIYIDHADSNLIGGKDEDARNVVSGNTNEGVVVFGEKALHNQIKGNYIGTDVFGNEQVGNLKDGVFLTNTKKTWIGGSDEGEGNLISGNLENGIELYKTDSVIIQENMIGLDEAGNKEIENQYSGIEINNSLNSLIGGEKDGEGNIISGNGEHGIVIHNNADGNRVKSNIIGSNADTLGDFPNGLDGIVIYDRSSFNVIGEEEAGNVIVNNTDNGIQIEGANSLENDIRANSIYQNELLGIDHQNDGVSNNDPNDGDNGPNKMQNFPRVTTAYAGVQLTINGELNTAANAEFRLDFYSNDQCDASGYGEGKQYLGSKTVMTGGNGRKDFTAIMPPVAVGKFITATATDVDGNTSEFSKCQEVYEVGSVTDLEVVKSSIADTVVKGDSATFSLTVVNHGPFTAKDVVVSDTLSTKISHLSSQTEEGDISVNGQVFECNIDSVAVGDTIEMEITVSADSIGTVVNIADVNANETDNVLQNDRGMDTLSIEKSTGNGYISDEALFKLEQNSPNPVQDHATIQYEIPQPMKVSIILYAMDGKQISTMVEGLKPKGRHSIDLNLSDLAGGIYLYQMRAGDFIKSRRMILLE